MLTNLLIIYCCAVVFGLFMGFYEYVVTAKSPSVSGIVVRSFSPYHSIKRFIRLITR